MSQTRNLTVTQVNRPTQNTKWDTSCMSEYIYGDAHKSNNLVKQEQPITSLAISPSTQEQIGRSRNLAIIQSSLNKMMEGEDQYYPTPKDHHDPVSCQNPSNKKKSTNGKRFSEEQIKSLESMFTLETKLEAHQKLKLARDLGLQPRQVGIWFQNKRARWKSKQIEQDYRALKAEFDSLKLQFDYLKKENESLLMQLEKLRYELENTPDGHKTSQDSKGSEIFSNLDNKDANFVIKENPGCLNGGAEKKMENNDILGMNKYLEQKEETEFLKMGALGDSPLSSQENWCYIGLGEAFYHSCETSKWWDI